MIVLAIIGIILGIVIASAMLWLIWQISKVFFIILGTGLRIALKAVFWIAVIIFLIALII